MEKTARRTPAPAWLPVAAAGAVLWVFLLAMPAVHLQLLGRATSLRLALLFGPLLVLAAGAVSGSRTTTIVAFPCSMLPLLATWPQIAGPRIYGLGAFCALIAATVTFLWVVLSEDLARPAPETRPLGDGTEPVLNAEHGVRALLLQTIAHGVVAAAIFYVVLFHRPVRALIAAAYSGYEGRATAFIGLLMFVCWVVALVRHLALRLGGSLMDRRKADAERFRFEAEALDGERITASLLWTVLIGLISGGALAIVLLAAE